MKILSKIVILSVMTSGVFAARHEETEVTVTAATGAGGAAADRVATSAPVKKDPACVLTDAEFVTFTAFTQEIASRIAELNGVIAPSSQRLRDMDALLEKDKEEKNEADVQSYTEMRNNTEAHRAPFLKERNALLAYRRSVNLQAHGREAISGEFAIVLGREGVDASTVTPVIPSLAMSAAAAAPLSSPRLMLPVEAALLARQAALEDRAPSGREAAFVS